jgi:hypothetical protein
MDLGKELKAACSHFVEVFFKAKEEAIDAKVEVIKLQLKADPKELEDFKARYKDKLLSEEETEVLKDFNTHINWKARKLCTGKESIYTHGFCHCCLEIRLLVGQNKHAQSPEEIKTALDNFRTGIYQPNPNKKPNEIFDVRGTKCFEEALKVIPLADQYLDSLIQKTPSPEITDGEVQQPQPSRQLG